MAAIIIGIHDPDTKLELDSGFVEMIANNYVFKVSKCLEIVLCAKNFVCWTITTTYFMRLSNQRAVLTGFQHFTNDKPFG